mgnify:CR=1 FL=1
MDDSTKEPEETEETVEAAPEEEVEKDTKRDTKKDTSAPDDKPAAARKGPSTPVWVALVVVALVVGVLGGHFRRQQPVGQDDPLGGPAGLRHGHLHLWWQDVRRDRA